MNEAQRAQFEKWAAIFDISLPLKKDKVRPHLYAHGNTEIAWAVWQAAYATGAAAARDEEIERFSRKYGHALWDTYCLCETMDSPFRSAAHVVIDEINFRATGHHFDAEAIRARQEQRKVKP